MSEHQMGSASDAKGRGADRRASPRVTISVPVNTYFEDDPVPLRMRDLSATGMFVYHPEIQQPLHSSVFLELNLPGEVDVIWAGGMIVREEVIPGDKPGVAVRFTAITMADQDRIQEFVERQLRNGPPSDPGTLD